MKRFSTVVLLAVFVAVSAGPAISADITQAELMQAAIELGRQYDANYADKNSTAMAALYAPDGLLVSPSGPIVRGREALRTSACVVPGEPKIPDEFKSGLVCVG